MGLFDLHLWRLCMWRGTFGFPWCGTVRITLSETSLNPKYHRLFAVIAALNEWSVGHSFMIVETRH